MKADRWVVGLDFSTQSASAAVVDPAEGRLVADVSIAYRDDPRTRGFGIEAETFLVPPREEGEADQPPRMFLAALDAILADLGSAGVDRRRIGAIALSAQQHGHVYLGAASDDAFASLLQDEATELSARFAGAFAYGTAPIWQTANTAAEADHIAAAVGGRDRVRELSGSDSPRRFTGAVIRRVATRAPASWAATTRVHLLSSFLSGVLTARADCPIDWGNGSGMSLMDYRARAWSPELASAVAGDLPGGADGLLARLPLLDAPTAVAGTVAPYFVARHGLDPGCIVTIGSGDNPQSKVMSSGDVLSLGTSFVLMVDTHHPVVDPDGFANSMYDGLGRPFVFACRTNGALVLERVRRLFGVDDDWEACRTALAHVSPGEPVASWQPFAESYPVASPYDAPEIIAAARAGEPFGPWYAAVVDSSLVLTWAYSKSFDAQWEGSEEPLAITGGPSRDVEIARRVASIWRRPVVRVAASGAAVGSALSAYAALSGAGADDLDRLRRRLAPEESPIEPDGALVARYHGDGVVDRIVEDGQLRAAG